ncbi:alpha-2-HS-glycoprotein 1 [Scleropages formosus]|uniref:alpha-2-HS-glycoprotein 1 n=1 Tax=Scleropages formosus TaxID=113540 RepID=UPI0010FA641B|nr:alpha-2-HS-glycoprotein-like [Scleropages formosus]
MRALIVLSLLIQVLSIPPPPHVDPHPVTCDEKGVQEASQAAEKQIAVYHHHGYKYRLTNTASSKLQKKDDTECEFHLELVLEETDCHVVNPKPLEECQLRQMHETKVVSNCNVTLTIVNGKTFAIKYSCHSEPASAEELVKVCPDCPSLLSLTDPKGLESIKEAMKKFHAETNETNYWKMLEVGRISTQYMFQGQSYFAQFAIVETTCLRQDNPEESKCKMLGKEEVRFGFCTSTLLGDGEITVDCDLYEAQNTTAHYHHHHHHFHHGVPGGRHHGPHSHDGPPPHHADPPKHPGGHTEDHVGPPGKPDGPPKLPHGPPKLPHGPPGHHDGHPPVLKESSEHHHPRVCGMPPFRDNKIHPIRSFPPPFMRPGFKGCHHHHTIPPTNGESHEGIVGGAGPRHV